MAVPQEGRADWQPQQSVAISTRLAASGYPVIAVFSLMSGATILEQTVGQQWIPCLSLDMG